MTARSSAPLRSVLHVAIVAAVAACGSGSRPALPIAARPREAGAPAERAPARDDAPARPPDVRGEAASSPPAPVSVPVEDAHRTREADLDAWLASRGVAPAVRAPLAGAGGCEAIAVGSPPEDAIVCDEVEHVARSSGRVFRVVVHRRARVVRNRSPVVVLDAVVGVTQLDKLDVDDPGIVDLELTFAADGLVAVIGDPSAERIAASRHPLVTCSEAQAGLSGRAPDPVLGAWTALDRDLVGAACGARGPLYWRAGRFVRSR